MEPEIEVWLEEALVDVRPTIAGVARVSLEPDYESGLTPDLVPDVKRQLLDLLSGAQLSGAESETHEGQTLGTDSFPALHRFLRRIALHGGDAPQQPWIDVQPAGNWI